MNTLAGMEERCAGLVSSNPRWRQVKPPEANFEVSKALSEV